jgi:lysozyme family protein
MANYNLILPHIKVWEGKRSADPRDTCSDVLSDFIETSGSFKGKAVHTVKGVCYKTWLAASKALGFDPSGKAFVNMTTKQWEQIVKLLFWDAMNLDDLRSQNIAELMLEVRWGSGAGAQGKIFFTELQRLIGMSGKDLDGFVGPKTIAAINQFIATKGNEAKLYKSLWEFRYNQMDKLGQLSKYAWARDGWLNRMRGLLERSKSIVMDNPKTFGILGLLILSGVAYGVYRYVSVKYA